MQGKKGFLLINVYFLLLLFYNIPLFSQIKREGLIFSEVYLNKNNPNKSWLEIYNPTTIPLVLESIRFYHIKTTNILPEEIQKEGGIEISPGECLILCVNESDFDFQVSKNSKIIQVKAIRHFGKGGFFSLRTKGMGEEGIDIFRYGSPEETSGLKDQLGSFVVPFSDNDKSYTRIKSEMPGERFLPNFIPTEPSPGHHEQ